MKTPIIPDTTALQPMTPLEMNAIHFNPKHTVLTPELLKTLQKSPE